MILKSFSNYTVCGILLSVMLSFAAINCENINKIPSGPHDQGPLSTNLNPSQPFTLSKSESGFHSSGSRGNYGDSNTFSSNIKKQKETSSGDEKGLNSYVTPNVEELLETLNTKTWKRRINSKSLNIAEKLVTTDSTKR